MNYADRLLGTSAPAPVPSVPVTPSYADRLLGTRAPSSAASSIQVDAPTSPQAADIVSAATSRGALVKPGEPFAMTGHAPEPSFVERGQMAISGLDRREFPDLPIFEANHADDGQSLKYALGTLLAASPKAERDVALKQLPGVKISQDRFGNYIADFDGERGYLNPKGLTSRDIARGALLTALFAPLAEGASALTAGRGLLARMGAQSAAGATGSLATDLAAKGMGSEQGVSAERAMVSAGGGALGETVGTAVNTVANHLAPAASILDATGNLLPEAATALRSAGVDPATASPELISALQDAVHRSGTIPAAGRAAVAGEFGIPSTRAQTTNDVGDWSFEEAARNNAKGNLAGNIVRSGYQAQQQATDTAKDVLAQRLAGGQSVAPDPLAAGEVVREGIRSREAAHGAAINQAYQNAAGMRDTVIGAEAFRDLPRRVHDALNNADIIPDELTPATQAALRSVQDFAQFREASPLRPDEQVIGVSLRGVEQLRRRLNNRFPQAANPTDRRALSIAKDELDNWIDDAVDRSLISGNPAALDALKQARDIRADYSARFGRPGSTNDTDRIMQKIINTDATDKEVGDWLFGAYQVGLRGESVRLATRLQGVLGQNSPEWQAIREGAWRKVVERPEGTTPYGPQATAERILKFVNGEGRGLANALYTPEELDTMRRFAQAMRQQVPPKEATNPSRTSYGMARLMGSWLSNLAGALGFSMGGGVAGGVAAREAANVGLGLRNALKAVRATQGAPRLPSPAAPALLPAGGAIAGYLSSANGR